MSRLQKKRERGIVFCVAFAAFAFQFEAFLVNVSLPTIAVDLNISTTAASFVVLVYLVAATVTFLPAGRLGDARGLKRTFIQACFLAAVGTLLCGLSTNFWMLLGARMVQGIGAGGMAALGYAMLPAWLAENRVGWGYGYLSMGSGLGMLAGVPAGGILAQFTNWHWLFLVNTLPMAMLLIFARHYLPGQGAQHRGDRPSGIVKILMFSGALAGAIFGISLGDELGWDSPVVSAAIAAAAVLTLALVYGKHVNGRALFPPGLLSCPGLAASLAVHFLAAMVFGGANFLMPFYLVQSCGFTTLLASAVLVVYPAMYAAAAPRAGLFADRIGPKPMVLAATLLGAVACSAFSVLLSTGKTWIILLFLISLGMSRGMFFAPNNRFVMTRIPPEKKGEGAALLPITLNMGTIFGISIFETVFSGTGTAETVLRQHLPGAQAPHLQMMLDQGFFRAFFLAALFLFIAAAVSSIFYRDQMEDQIDTG